MTITFYGENCFKISARGGSALGGQSKETTILTDPFVGQTGLTPPRFKSDILIKTLIPFPPTNQQINQETNRLISGPGEYNIKDIDIAGFELFKESTEKFIKTIYLIKMEGVKIGFLGHLVGTLEPEILERFEETDILFVPAGGSPFIEQKAAVKLIKQLEPKIVIPCLFKIPGLKRRADDVKEFIEEFNHQKPVPQEKLTIKKKDLEEIKKTEIVILKI